MGTLKKMLMLAAVTLLPAFLYAQGYENDYFIFDNPKGNIVQENNLLNPKLTNRAMNLSVKEWSLKNLGMDYRDWSAVLVASSEARVAVFVFDDRVPHVADVATQQYYEALKDEASKAVIKININKNPQRTSTVSNGDPASLFTEKTETVSFMGDPKATLHSLDIDLSNSVLCVMFEVPVMVRLQTYCYYDTECDKTVVAVFHQFGVNRNPNAAVALEGETYKALLALLGGRPQINGSKENDAVFRKWRDTSTWKDMRPLFEKYFHLKKKRQGQGQEEKTDTTTIKDKKVVIINGQIIDLLPPRDDPKPKPDPPIKPRDPQPTPPPDPDPHPESGWRLKIGECNAPSFAENDTAVFVKMNGKQIVSINKKTWKTSAINNPNDRRNPFIDITCNADDHLLAYVAGVGLVDEHTKKTIWVPENPVNRFRLLYNPANKHVVAYDNKWAVELRSDGEELYAYEVERLSSIGIDADGHLRLYSGSYPPSMMLANGEELTEIDLPPRSVNTNSGVMGINAWRGKTVYRYEHALYADNEEMYVCDYNIELLRKLVTDSKGELYTCAYNKGIIHFTGNPVSGMEILSPDLRFTSETRSPNYDALYIDRNDNFWIVQNRNLYVWRR